MTDAQFLKMNGIVPEPLPSVAPNVEAAEVQYVEAFGRVILDKATFTDIIEENHALAAELSALRQRIAELE